MASEPTCYAMVVKILIFGDKTLPDEIKLVQLSLDVFLEICPLW